MRKAVATKAAEAMSADGLDAARAAARAEAERAKLEKARKRAQSRRAKKAKARAQREAKARAPQEDYDSASLKTLEKFHLNRNLHDLAIDVQYLSRNLEGRAHRLNEMIDRYKSLQREAEGLGMKSDAYGTHLGVPESARFAVTALKKLLNNVGADTADISDECTPDECTRPDQGAGYVTDSDEDY